MDEHRLTDGDEELLQCITLGETSAHHPDVLARAEASPGFRDALRETLEAQDALGGFGADALQALGEVDDKDHAWATWAVARATEQDAPQPLHAVTANTPGSRRALVGLAAALVLGTGLTWALWPEASAETPATAPQHLGGDLTWLSPAPGTRLRPGLRVAWDCGPPAPGGGFRVELCATDGSVLDSVVTREESLGLPDAWSDVPAGAERALRVHALDSTGTSVHRSMLLRIGGH